MQCNEFYHEHDNEWGRDETTSNLRLDVDVSGPSRIAMILNVFQPVILLLCIITDIDKAFTAVFMYVLLMSTDFSELWIDASDISPKEGCSHLNLGYWNLSRTLLYVFSSMICFIEFENKFWGWLNMIIFLMTLIISVLVYNCGGGSMWCWMISFSGLILVISEYFKLYKYFY